MTTDRKRIITSTSVYSLIVGIGLRLLVPDYTGAILLFNTIGVGGIGYLGYTWSKFDTVFKNLGLGVGISYPILKTKTKGEYSTTYKFTLPPGLSTEDIIKKQTAIEEHIGKKINIEYINKGLFIVEVFKNSSQQFYDYEPTEISGNVPILIGKDRKGRLIFIDLSDGEPHLLIAGTTGCGKSTALRSMITNLILTTNVNLHLVDLKHGAEFSVFKKSSHVKSFADTLDLTEKVLKTINDEIEARYKKMALSGFNDITGYNKRHQSNPMPYELLIIDEMTDIQQRKDLFFDLECISAKARACGIHMILSTQRPDKDVLNGRIKTNVTNVLGLKTKDGTNSRIIIDTDGLEKLKGKGNGLFSSAGDITEIQTPKLDMQRTKDLIKHTYVFKSEPKLIPCEKVELDITDLEVFQ
jgi:S-DNA-T family DNA segregation ATPase FtsK/SpoIIIE